MDSGSKIFGCSDSVVSRLVMSHDMNETDTKLVVILSILFYILIMGYIIFSFFLKKNHVCLI